MSTTTARVPLAQAEALAGELVDLLSPYCERLVIAGSIRRRRPEVKDIEIVAIPKLEHHYDLFGAEYETVDHLSSAGVAMLARGEVSSRLDKNGRPAFGSRYKRLLYRGVGLDLFSVLPPAQFGAILAIRTGPAEFSKRLMTQRRFGGWLPNHWQSRDGALWDGMGELVPTPEEEDLFAAVGMEWIAPEKRIG